MPWDVLAVSHVSTWMWWYVRGMFSHRNGSKWSAHVPNEFLRSLIQLDSFVVVFKDAASGPV